MKRIAGFFWREKMLTLSLLAAAVALTITPFTPARLMEIDWRTLGNLMMMLCVLEGVKPVSYTHLIWWGALQAS